jgi:hypothetical protein
VPQWLPFFDLLAERYELLVPKDPGFGTSDDRGSAGNDGMIAWLHD